MSDRGARDRFAGRVAIIGWGSLIWDLDDLAPRVAGDWAIGAGPSLPLEFSRISPKRKRALAVCIDTEAGAPCPTSAIASIRDDPAAAARDLMARERARSLGQIGFVAADGAGRTANPALRARMEDWCAATGATGAVWTDLEANFAEIRGAPFSVAAGLRYLGALRGESRREAVRYIEQAPVTTDTPLRRALSATPWWRRAAAEILGGPCRRADGPPSRG